MHDLNLGQNVINACDWDFVYKIIHAKLGKIHGKIFFVLMF